MAAFEGTAPSNQTNSVGSGAAVDVFTANATAFAALSPAVTLHDVTIINVGPATVYLGSSSVTAATGLALKAGQQATIQGWTATTGTTTNDVWAITSSGTAEVIGALATLASVV
jgi:hypothetical protein